MKGQRGRNGCGEERSESRNIGGGWEERRAELDECVWMEEEGGGAFCKAVAWTYCALMGWLSFLLPFFFAVEEQY